LVRVRSGQAALAAPLQSRALTRLQWIDLPFTPA
jgi:hypothetical protein